MKKTKEIEAQNARIGDRVIGIGRILDIVKDISHVKIYIEKEKKSDPASKVHTAKYGQKIAIER